MLKRKKTAAAYLLTPFILLLVTACAELDSHSSFSRFERSENLYLSSMRWAEWSTYLYLLREKPSSNKAEKMITIRDPSTAKKYEVVEDQTSSYNNLEEEISSREALVDHLNTIKVKRAEVLSSSMNSDGETGESRILIEYRFDNSAKINSIRHKVRWWYDEESNTWFSETPMPKEFKPKQPLSGKKKTIKLSPN
ncbi:MAG: hypothetical protein GY694_04125 [Gammaproteobacteria bacterium]|nr:hypothetical protein [Gammaproteobacteria bacterium]